ncbi:MAG: FAD-dependent oxidoreductase [Novosphingobium sp.]
MAAHPKYPNVFSPLRIGPIEVPNRYYFSPHGVPLTHGCGPSNDLVAYCTERVKDGGAGLVILSCTAHQRGRHYQPCPYPPEAVPAFRALADAVHAAGGKIIGQIWYHWLSAGNWGPLTPPAPSFAPSSSQFGFGGSTGATHVASHEDIRMMGEAHRQSARHLREAGFDGVEIHASHSGMIEQFLSPYFNRRTDEYGGSLRNRMRLLVETLDMVRQGAGPDLAVGMRLNCDELVEGGYDTLGAHDALAETCKSGLIDFVDLDVAMEPLQLKYGMPSVLVKEHFYQSYVEKVRTAAGKLPVLSVLGRVTQMSHAEQVIASGLCDMVGSARQLIAEPQFVRHAHKGTEHLGRTCIACQFCLSGMADGAFGCAINPASYRERIWGVDKWDKAARKARVVVVGGGPGGLEAARAAALRGHKVTLLEARKALGGALALWAKLPGREFYSHAIDWWERELARLGVTVVTGNSASAADVLALKPQAVVLATGALFDREGRAFHCDRPIPGADRKHVFTPEDILLKGKKPKGKVLLVDAEGTHASAGIAEILANKGCEVTMISANYAPFSTRLLAGFEADPVVERLAGAGVVFHGATWVRKIGANSVTIYDIASGKERKVKVDAVVLATGRQPQNGLADQLEGKVKQLFTVGDAMAIRMWAASTFEAHKFARMIGEPGAPATTGAAWFAADDPAIYPAPAG